MPEKQVKKQAKKRVLPESMRKVMWKPGQSGNPSGRPKKGTALAEVLREYLNEEVDTPNGKLLRSSAFIRAVYAKAIKGGDAAQRLIMQYIDGMPVQTIKTQEIKDDDKFDKLTEDQIAKLREIDDALNNDLS